MQHRGQIASPPSERDKSENVADRGAIEVAAGLVYREGKLLITQRRSQDHLGGLWEFPGGKREAGENFESCLIRELREELGIEVAVGELVDDIAHDYPEKKIHLRFYRCVWIRNEPQAIGCQSFAWVRPSELAKYSFPPADARLLEKLRDSAETWR